MHPLTTDDKGIVDALNATLITYNGNEMILQNDMGNTLIQDSATGNIMGLSPGFIPIGLKEHGGIMYIASVNKDGEGEIGTIPSPIIRDFYKDMTTKYVQSSIPISPNPPVKITNKLYPADKFIANLRMNLDDPNSIIGIKSWKLPPMSDISDGDPNYDPSDCRIKRYTLNSKWFEDEFKGERILSRPVVGSSTQYLVAPSGFGSNWKEINTPLISYANGEKGIYKIKIHTFNEQGHCLVPESSYLYES
jgi:hypothetical protein